MNRVFICTLLICGWLGGAPASAQKATSTAPSASTTAKPDSVPPPKPTLAQLGLIVYPAKGQSKEQQAKDEEACYQWAEAQTGIQLSAGAPDSKAAGKVAAAKMDSAATGAAVAGAARGAVAGVAIGAIAGDAGTGAAIGAVAGAMSGRRAKKQAVKQAEQAGAQEAEKKNKEMIDQFKKAVCACLEGRGYTCK